MTITAEILTIGTELLQGAVDDTNATHIARKLGERGIYLKYRTTVGDKKSDIIDALLRAVERTGLVICTGGLGPTVDDITIECAAEAFGMELALNEPAEKKLRGFFSAFGFPFAECNLKQVMIPVGTQIIENRTGTAPGVSICRDGKTIWFFPGVPREMEAMLGAALDSLQIDSAESQTFSSHSLRVFGIGESTLQEKLPDEITRSENPTFSFLPHHYEVELRLTARGRDKDECSKILAPAVEKIKNILGDYVYGEGEDNLELAAIRRLKEAGLTVSVAESCTGGLVGAKLAGIAGASEVFAGGMITYSTKAKIELLGVPAELIERRGAVSEAVAIAMAERAVYVFDSDAAVSVTGNAGPSSGDGRSEVGRIYVAIAFKKGGKPPVCVTRKMKRERNDVRNIAAKTALDLIRKYV